MLLSGITPIKNFDYFVNLGYDAIDVSFCATIYTFEKHKIEHDSILDGDAWLDNVEAYRKKCVDTGTKINTTHLPYRYDYSDTVAHDYKYHFDMTCRAFKASEFLGAKWTVVHFHNDGIEKTVAHVRKLFETTGVKNTGIAIENDMIHTFEPILEACEILKREGYNVGICLDTGHCNVNTVNNLDVAESIRMLGSDLKMLHVHDNCRNGDYHLEPFAGNIKWNEVMKALKDINFRGDLNFEINVRRIPEALRYSYDKYCVEIGRYLISLFEEAKNEKS